MSGCYVSDTTPNAYDNLWLEIIATCEYLSAFIEHWLDETEPIVTLLSSSGLHTRIRICLRGAVQMIESPR